MREWRDVEGKQKDVKGVKEKSGGLDEKKAESHTGDVH